MTKKRKEEINNCPHKWRAWFRGRFYSIKQDVHRMCEICHCMESRIDNYEMVGE